MHATCLLVRSEVRERKTDIEGQTFCKKGLHNRGIKEFGDITNVPFEHEEYLTKRLRVRLTSRTREGGAAVRFSARISRIARTLSFKYLLNVSWSC